MLHPELTQHVRDVHDTLSWLCFCIMVNENRVFSDVQISVILHTELKQVRTALTRLWNDDLVVRTNANGLWRVDIEKCSRCVVDRLKTILAAEKSESSEDENCLQCPDCDTSFDLNSEHVIEALMSGTEPCCHCGKELCQSQPKENIIELVTSRLHAAQVITRSASSEPDA